MISPISMKTTNDLLDSLKDVFKDEYPLFLEKLEEDPKRSFFVSELYKGRDEILKMIDFEVSPNDLNPSVFSYQINNISSKPVYDLGLIYGQDLASSIVALTFPEAEDPLIIDLCVAPGGKSIDIYNRFKGNCLLVANEIERKRANIMLSNFERLGLANFILSNDTTEKVADNFENKADIVIVDAPCSGEGMLRKSNQVTYDYSPANIASLKKIQLRILDDAYRCLKQGACLSYSTCTYNIHENEEVVLEFLTKYPEMELLKIDIDHQRRGLDILGDKKDRVVRFNVIDRTEGQFIALFRKKSELNKPERLKSENSIRNNVVERFIEENLDLDNYYLYQKGSNFYLSLRPFPVLDLNVLRPFVYLGELSKNIFYPSHHLYKAHILMDRFKNVSEVDDQEFTRFIRGEEIAKDLPDAWYQVRYLGVPLGFGKLSQGRLKNKYPKGLRR